jgi:hypothetical protein
MRPALRAAAREAAGHAGQPRHGDFGPAGGGGGRARGGPCSP